MSIISRAAFCCIGLIVAVIVAMLLFPGLNPIPTGGDDGDNDGQNGDLSFTFYDKDGRPVQTAAYVSEGTIVTAWKTTFHTWITSNTPELELIETIVEGRYTITIYGLDADDVVMAFEPTETFLWSGDYTFYDELEFEPWDYVFDWTTYFSILDSWPQYQDKAGWKIKATISSNAIGNFDDGTTGTADWSGVAWFTVQWTSGSITLGGEMGFE